MSSLLAGTDLDAATALDVIEREHAMSLSLREWKHRVKGLGYTIREGADGLVVAALRTGAEICRVPDRLH